MNGERWKGEESMGESKKEVKKFDMDWWKDLTELDEGL